jgi:hypothetical protein
MKEEKEFKSKLVWGGRELRGGADGGNLTKVYWELAQ